MNNVGVPCRDEGEELPLHGSINHTPAERVGWKENNSEIILSAVVNPASPFGDMLNLNRKIICSKEHNTLVVEDTIVNEGWKSTPCMLLYHVNLGFPLLNENVQLTIPSDSVVPRDEQAAAGLDTWAEFQKPTAGIREQCFFHSFSGEGKAVLFNPDLDKGLNITFDAESLNHFVQWKMPGYRDYVLGLEPGNCHPDGRNRMRAEGKLKILEQGERGQLQGSIYHAGGDLKDMAVAGIDVGTSGCKCTVYKNNGEFLKEAYREYSPQITEEKHTISPVIVWESVKQVIKEALDCSETVQAVGVTTFGEAPILLDEMDEPILDSPIFSDPRGKNECDALTGSLGTEYINRSTGLNPGTMYTISKLMWIRINQKKGF